jgi:hypothetical protein
MLMLGFESRCSIFGQSGTSKAINRLQSGAVVSALPNQKTVMAPKSHAQPLLVIRARSLAFPDISTPLRSKYLVETINSINKYLIFN